MEIDYSKNVIDLKKFNALTLTYFDLKPRFSRELPRSKTHVTRSCTAVNNGEWQTRVKR